MRGVFVAGMHSGGTSAITGALIGLGLGGPVDSPEPSGQHPYGIFESPRVWRFNEELLDQLGSSSEVGIPGVPAMPADWHDDPRIIDSYVAGAARLGDAFPNEPWAVKDPRLCVLLPFWRRVVADDVAAVLVVRNPVDTADSYKDWLSADPAGRLAWWEHYMRTAIRDLDGLPVLVTNYDDALAEPSAWCHAAAAWLEELGLPITRDNVDEAAAVLDPGVRKHNTGTTDLSSVPESCRMLYMALREASGTYNAWDSSQF
jgi:hypothetical protein